MSTHRFLNKLNEILAEAASYDFYKDKLTKEVYDEIIKADPTQNGKYQKWLINLYLKLNAPQQKRFLAEDWEMTKAKLSVYDKVKNKNLFEPEDQKFKQIDLIKSLAELTELTQKYQDKLEKTEKGGKALADKVQESKDYKIIYKKDGWIAVIPETFKASCQLGENSSWCTATPGQDTYYKRYSAESPLIIVVKGALFDPKNTNRWQFHAHSKQYMDIHDNRLMKSEKKEFPEELQKLLFEKYNINYFNENTFDIDQIIKVLKKDRKLLLAVFKNLMDADWIEITSDIQSELDWMRSGWTIFQQYYYDQNYDTDIDHIPFWETHPDKYIDEEPEINPDEPKEIDSYSDEQKQKIEDKYNDVVAKDTTYAMEENWRVFQNYSKRDHEYSKFFKFAYSWYKEFESSYIDDITLDILEMIKVCFEDKDEEEQEEFLDSWKTYIEKQKPKAFTENTVASRFVAKLLYIVEGAQYSFYKDKIDTETFNKLIELDPTHNKSYARWIVETYIHLEKSSKGTARMNRFWEDAYRITEALRIYEKFKNKKGYIEGNKRNILSFKFFSELESFIDTLPKEDEGETKNVGLKPGKDFEKLYEDKEWLIVTPFTHLASCKYGAHTKWCTAATSSNHFDRYAKQGKLYIIINKVKNKKFQFHNESSQFLNEEDQRLTKSDKDLLRAMPTQAIEILKEAGAPVTILQVGEHDNFEFDSLEWLVDNYPNTICKFFVGNVNHFDTIYESLWDSANIDQILNRQELINLIHEYDAPLMNYFKQSTLKEIMQHYGSGSNVYLDSVDAVKESIEKRLKKNNTDIFHIGNIRDDYSDSEDMHEEMENFFLNHKMGKEWDK